MPKIIPIRDLRDTAAVSKACHAIKEPIFVTKNGYDDMVVMSMQTYEQSLARAHVYEQLNVAEAQVAYGKVSDARTSLKKFRKRLHA